jgi:hypothetical protein
VSTGQAAALAEMLRLVEDHERARCREIAAQAQNDVRDLLREAHAAARLRMHRHVQDLKHFRDRETARARAELETAHRRHRQRCDRVLLEAGWALLRPVLAARWREPAARRRWVERLAREALARLPRGDWTVVCPADWDRAERAALAQELGTAPTWQETPDVSAGLRFCAGGACLDGTLEGLLADRAAIEAMLLAEIG